MSKMIAGRIKKKGKKRSFFLDLVGTMVHAKSIRGVEGY
jgi:hypothetical protein